MKRFIFSIFISFFIFTNIAAALETAETIYAKAYGALHKGNKGEAMRLFEKGQKYYPDCAFLFAGMGDVYLSEKKFDKAMEFYTLAQRKKYALDIYKIDFYNAHLQNTMVQISDALTVLFSATKNSENPILYKNIKYILNEEYSKVMIATEVYQNTDNLQLNYANQLRKAENREEAVKEYLKILNINPKDFRAANNLGVTFLELKDYQLAEKYLQEALGNNQNSALILNNLAIVNFQQKKYEEMEKNFALALKYKNDYILAINNYAVAKIQMGLQFYQPINISSILEVINKDNENFFAVRTLAKIYFLKGDFKNADLVLEQISSPYNFKLYTQKSYVAYKNGDYEKALRLIDEAIKLYSDNGIDYLLRARIYTAMGNYAKAKENFDIASEKDLNNNKILYYKALMFYKSGDISSANNCLKQFILTEKGNENSSQNRLLLD